MPPRPGHHAPLGTIRKIRLDDLERAPELGDVALAASYRGGDPAELERAYRVVGVEECRNSTSFRLLLERIEWRKWHRGSWLVGEPTVWAFYTYPLRSRRG